MASRSRNKPEHHTNLRQIDSMYSLKVDNLAYRTRVVDLQRCFEKFGPIGDIYVPRDQFSHSNRGYAFVRFIEKRDAQNAIDRMDGADIDGREIRVQLARYNRGSGSGSDGRNKTRSRRSRSRSGSRRRRSKQRSRSNSGSSGSNRSAHRRSRSRSSRRSRSKSHSERNQRPENGKDDHQQEKN